MYRYKRGYYSTWRQHLGIVVGISRQRPVADSLIPRGTGYTDTINCYSTSLEQLKSIPPRHSQYPERVVPQCEWKGDRVALNGNWRRVETKAASIYMAVAAYRTSALSIWLVGAPLIEFGQFMQISSVSLPHCTQFCLLWSVSLPRGVLFHSTLFRCVAALRAVLLSFHFCVWPHNHMYYLSVATTRCVRERIRGQRFTLCACRLWSLSAHRLFSPMVLVYSSLISTCTLLLWVSFS